FRNSRDTRGHDDAAVPASQPVSHRSRATAREWARLMTWAVNGRVERGSDGGGPGAERGLDDRCPLESGLVILGESGARRCQPDVFAAVPVLPGHEDADVDASV